MIHETSFVWCILSYTKCKKIFNKNTTTGTKVYYEYLKVSQIYTNVLFAKKTQYYNLLSKISKLNAKVMATDQNVSHLVTK